MQPIDWDALREQLNQQNDTQALEALLHQRARQYASIHTTPQEAAATLTMLAFRLGEERYAVDVMLVQTVRAVGKLTAVPGVPRFYRGVVNIRGQIITALDLRLFFDIPAASADDLPGELIVIEANRLKIGLLVHHVQDILRIAEDEIEPLNDTRYTLGITQNRLTLLDGRRLLEDERLIIGGLDE